MTTPDVTRTLPVLPIKNTVLYPYLLMPLSVGRERSIKAIEAAAASEDKTLFIVAQKDGRVDSAHGGIELFVNLVPNGLIFPAVDRVRDEQRAEEHDFRNQERPHSQDVRFVLLF